VHLRGESCESYYVGSCIYVWVCCKHDTRITCRLLSRTNAADRIDHAGWTKLHQNTVLPFLFWSDIHLSIRLGFKRLLLKIAVVVTVGNRPDSISVCRTSAVVQVSLLIGHEWLRVGCYHFFRTDKRHPWQWYLYNSWGPTHWNTVSQYQP